MKRLLPPALGPGDRVGLAAPSSPVRSSFLERGEDVLRSLGLVPVRAPHLLERSRYTAGSPGQRAADLRAFLEDPAIAGIFFARGGYGALHLLERLEPSLLASHPKVLLGSSDTTCLLLHALEGAGLACFHGPMPAGELAAGLADTGALMRVVGEPRPAGRVRAPQLRALSDGEAEAELTGGCLSLVAALVGTPFAPSTRGRILFLEDRSVKPYQMDRLLTQLRHAGLLDGIAALVFGEMLDCFQHPEQGYHLDEVLADLTADLGVPVLCGLPSGHTSGGSQTLPLGVMCRVSSSPPSFEITGPAVAPRVPTPPTSEARRGVE